MHRTRARNDVRGLDLHLGGEVNLPRGHLVEQRRQHDQLDHACRGVLGRAVHAHDAGGHAHGKIRDRDGLAIRRGHLLDGLADGSTDALDIGRIVGNRCLANGVNRRNRVLLRGVDGRAHSRRGRRLIGIARIGAAPCQEKQAATREHAGKRAMHHPPRAPQDSACPYCLALYRHAISHLIQAAPRQVTAGPPSQF